MKHLQVAVGIIRNANQEIFLARRAADSHMANMWEFPGGKIEPGESAEQALKRELLEETGIEVTQAKVFDRVDHTYQDLRVTLHFFLVEAWNGEPFGREGQPQRWVKQRDLVAEEFPPANYPLVARLKAESHQNH
ncbi:8-oxo-dGTP diphosphatase [Paramixta manurensis]|uniref:8-oxo-dGTP diphosphatase n=1 Tax=Paramixta manurensis TaxID=2740817 RepID=A0A6M8UBM8_9GAMM|nr:8-oxo-dGTP diphosphatase [Erwiniaceae bacterium PD-1]